MYYNKERKEKYLKACNYDNLQFIELLFKLSSPVEYQKNKDLCEYNRKEIIELLTAFNFKSRTTLVTACVYLSNYYAWCDNEGLIDISTYNQYESKRSNSIIEEVLPKELLNERYFTKEELLGYMSNVYDISNKFIMYAIFCGLDKDELINLKKTDLNEKEKTIALYTGEIIPVDDLFIELMKKTIDSQYYNPDGELTSKRYDLYEYANSPYVLRKTKRYDDLPWTYIILNKRFVMIKKQTGNRFLSVPVIYNNGMINYIKENLDVSLRVAFSEKTNGRVYKYTGEVEELIGKFRSKRTFRALKRDIIDEFIDCFE
jgi:integrase